MWIATSAGAAVFDGVDRWAVFTAKNSRIPAGNIYKVSVDKQGNAWFGSDSKGLARLSGFKMPSGEQEAAEPAATAPAQTKEALPEEKIRINAFLSEGYITISMESRTATVTFYNSNGEAMRQVKNYKNGQRIGIERMARGTYTVGVNTARGERKIKFNLK